MLLPAAGRFDVVPDATVALNQIFRQPYTMASQASRTPAAPPGQRVQNGPCPSERCYGAATVGWRTQLAECAKGLPIGIIDTAIDDAHPALHDRKIKQSEIRPPGAHEAAPIWHGTGIASVLAGNADSSTPGLIPGADIYATNIFFADKSGNAISDSAAMLGALDLMDRFGVKIINMSVSGGRDELVERMVQKLADKGVIIVSAAGNGGPDAPPSYPAAYPQVIAVTAVNRDKLGYSHANRGNYIDIAAPGVNIWTALPGMQEGYQTGTSFAVPYATAVISAVYRQSPLKTKEALLGALQTTDLGAPGRDPVYGRGLINAPTSCKPQLNTPAPSAPAEMVRAPQMPVQPAAFGFGSFGPSGAN